MKFILRHLSDALVLLKEYKSGCAELSWLIEAHLRRVDEIVDDVEIRRRLRTVKVDKSENLKVVEEVYNEIALKELQAAGKVSVSCSCYVNSEKKLLLEEGKEILCDRFFPELTGKKEIIEEDEVVVTDESEESDSDEEIEFSFERV